MVNDKTKAKERMKRYRQQNRRIDYVPNSEALEIINRIKEENSEMCLAEVLDGLIIVGGKHYYRK